MRIGVLHGPNLNLLGVREPHLYGSETLSRIEEAVREEASRLAVETLFFQSNHEGALIEWVQDTAGDVEGFVVNAAALTHTSIALRDALAAADRPFVEVHLTNPLAREPFRRRSVLADLAIGHIAGFGGRSYVLGLRALVEHLRSAG